MSRRAAEAYERNYYPPRENEYSEIEITRRREPDVPVSKPARERDYEEIDIVRRREPERPAPRPVRERDFDHVEVVRRREPDPPPARSVRGSDFEEVEIVRRREPEPKPTRVVREREREYEEVDVLRRRLSESQLSRPQRPRERDYEEIDIVHRHEAPPERPRRTTGRERDFEELEIIHRHDHSPDPPKRTAKGRDFDEISIAHRRDAGPPERSRRPPGGGGGGGGGGRSRDYEEIDIVHRRDSTPERPRRPVREREREYEEIEITRRRDRTPERRGPPVRERDWDEVDVVRIREERDRPPPEFMREDYGKTDSGALVIREREREVETVMPARPQTPQVVHEQPVHQEMITHHRHIDHGIERTRPPSPPPVPPTIHQEVITHHRHVDHGIERTRPLTPPPPPVIHQEIITHHRHIDHGMARVKPPTPPPPPVIHQEIITHHRHIDHGFERAAPSPPPPPAPVRRTVEREVEVERRTTTTSGREVHDDERHYERKTTTRAQESETRIRRRRSVGDGLRTQHRLSVDANIAAEAEYYNRRAEDRGFIGEAYNGATKDWTIVDVPPGTERVQMDGVGGGSQEITWQRYNGVRRARFIPEREDGGEVYDTRDERTTRRFVAERDRYSDMWTEITKDLVVREAIEAMGYEFDETEYFFYVMKYLRYEDVLHLVELTQDIRRGRHDRIREIQWERDQLEGRGGRRATVDEERIVEREVVYEGRRPPPRYLR